MLTPGLGPSWALPVTPDYSDAEAEIEAAVESIEAEREEAQEAGGAAGGLVEYFDELERAVDTFRDSSSEDSAVRRYSRMLKGVLRVHRRARAADLPSGCSFGLTTAAAKDLGFQRKAAIACWAAGKDIRAAPVRAEAGSGSRLERFIRLQGMFGRIYIDLAQELSEVASSNTYSDPKKLVKSWRRAGLARIASEVALQAGDDAGSSAAARAFERHNERAKRLVRSLELPFCQELLP